MKYQLTGLWVSLLIHALAFTIGFGSNYFSIAMSAPMPIELGMLSVAEPAPVKVAQHRNRLHRVKETITPAQQPETLSQTAVAERPMVKQEVTAPQTVTDESLKASQTAPNGSIVGPVFNADYLHNPKPPYPLIARRMKLEGTVMVRVLVSLTGKAEIVRMGTSSGSNVLDQAALTAVREWLFVPAQQGGQPVSAWVDVPIRFRLIE
jgi:periplasmic protein TonB